MNQNRNDSLSSASFSTPTASASPSSGASASAHGRDNAADELKASVAEGAHEISGEVKHIARDVAQHARKSAETQLTGGKDRAAEGLGEVAQALRQTGEQMREQEHASISKYVVRAADHVDEASHYLKDRKLGQILGDLETYVRREPGLLIGGAFVMGIIGGRFLKSSRSGPKDAKRESARESSEMGGTKGRTRSASGSQVTQRDGGEGRGGQSTSVNGARPVQDDWVSASSTTSHAQGATALSHGGTSEKSPGGV